MEIQKRLDTMRKARNYTLQQISDLSGVPLQTVRRIFEGTTVDPGITTINAIVNALRYTLKRSYQRRRFVPIRIRIGTGATERSTNNLSKFPQRRIKRYAFSRCRRLRKRSRQGAA